MAQGRLPRAAHFPESSTPEIAIARVAARVAQGGHNVRSAIVRRRFDSGLRNFQDIYMDLVDEWWWYDNSNDTPRLISTRANPR